MQISELHLTAASWGRIGDLQN